MKRSCIFGLFYRLILLGFCNSQDPTNVTDVINKTEQAENSTLSTFDGGGDDTKVNLQLSLNAETESYDKIEELHENAHKFCKAITYRDILEDLVEREVIKRNVMTLIPEYYEIREKAQKKLQCSPKNITENETGIVKIINSTFLLSKLNSMKSKNMSTLNYCAVVMFFAPWCPFCAEVAVHYNALARAFPHLDVYAIDAIAYNNLNFRFGTVAVPNIIIFHNSKPVARYNQSERTLEIMSSFVTNITGLIGNKTVVLPIDYDGPVPSTPAEENDYMLYLAYAVIIMCLCYHLPQTSFVQQMWITFGRCFGHTEQHAHID